MKTGAFRSALFGGMALMFSACAGRVVSRPVTTVDPQNCVQTTHLVTEKIKRGKATRLSSDLVSQQTDSVCAAHQRQSTITAANLREIAARREVSAKIIASSLAGNWITPTMRAELIKQALLNLQSADSSVVKAQSDALTEKGLSIPQLRAEDERNKRQVRCTSEKAADGSFTMVCKVPDAGRTTARPDSAAAPVPPSL